MKRLSLPVCLQFLEGRSGFHLYRRGACLCLTLLLGACGGGSSPSSSRGVAVSQTPSSPNSTQNPAGTPNPPASSTDFLSAPPATVTAGISGYPKVVRLAGNATAVVALFSNGQAFYSPDGFNLAGGGETAAAYDGNLQIINIEAVSGGIVSLLADGTVYRSPDGKNLGGGGATVKVNSGATRAIALAAVDHGVDVVFAAPAGTWFSPDGFSISGGRGSVDLHAGDVEIKQLVPLDNGAVLTLFANGTVNYSPDNRYLGGGGNTVAATTTSASVVRLVKVGGGVLTQFDNGQVYLSSTGMHLSGGGSTFIVPSWDNSPARGPFAPRDSARGVIFQNHLWLSGGFATPTNTDSCFLTCSFFDLWSSADSVGAEWNSSASFATAMAPNPRDVDPIVNNGVMDVDRPTDFYDSYSAIAVWNNQLTAVGSTVWRSPDGVVWTRNNQSDGTTAMPGPAPIRATENSRAVKLGSTLFFVQPDSGEVYSTTDPTAARWADLGAIPNFVPRCGSAVFTLQGRIWIVGGGACDYSAVFNELWSSPDGINWTLSPTNAQWSPRMWPCVGKYDETLVFIAGGYSPIDWTNTSGMPRVRFGANHADVWFTRDGGTWKQLKADAGSGLVDDGTMEARHGSTCYVGTGAAGQRTLTVVAGTGGADVDDSNARPLNTIRVLPLPDAELLQ